MIPQRLLILALMYLLAGSAALWVHGSAARRTGDASATPVTSDPLERRITRLRLRDVPLDSALRELSEISGAQIVPLWNNIKAEQIPRDTPITLKVENVSLGNALQVLLELASPDKDSRLGYLLEDNAIVVTSARDAGGDAVVRVYDVRDVAAAERQFASPPPLPVIEQTGSFVPGSDAESQLEDDLANLITQHIRPDTWIDNGGAVSSIRTVRGGLIIRTSPETHHQIEHFLHRLRAQLSRRR